MKRYAAVILAAGILLCGCGSSADNTEAESTTEAQAAAETEQTEEASENEETSAEETTEAETESAEAETETETEAETEAPTEAETQAQAEKTALSCDEVYTKCIDSGNFVEMVACDSDYVMNYFGIDTSGLKSYAVGEAMEAIKADALLLFEANSESEAAEIKAQMDSYLERKQNELENYNAEGYKKASAGVAAAKGNYVYVVICENPSAVVNIIEENI